MQETDVLNAEPRYRSFTNACIAEGLDPWVAWTELERGRAVFFCSKKSQQTKGFCGKIIGGTASKKVTALIGLAHNKQSPENILDDIDLITAAEPDFVMDLTTSECAQDVWKILKSTLTVPVGCGLTYFLFRDCTNRISPEGILRTIRSTLETGVDLILLHFGVTRHLLEEAHGSSRVMPLTSRGGGMIARYMDHFECENPLLELLPDIASMCAEYDVVLDLGDVFRPGCIADAGDRVKRMEIDFLADLRLRARKVGCTVLCESGGHIPLSSIPRVISEYKDALGGCPLWLTGPMPVDVAIGVDSIVNAIGVATAAQSGGDLFCSITDREHYAMPTAVQTAESVLRVKAAIAVAEVSLGSVFAWERNHRMSVARASNQWDAQVLDAISPALASTEFSRYKLTRSGQPCTICGPFCPHVLVGMK